MKRTLRATMDGDFYHYWLCNFDPSGRLDQKRNITGIIEYPETSNRQALQPAFVIGKSAFGRIF